MATGKVIKKAEGDLTAPITERPDWLPTENTSRGNENVGARDITVPRLEIVQSQSKALVKSHQNFIPDAKVGMLYNSVTRQVYGSSVVFVPVVFEKEWLIWVNRKLAKPGAGGTGFRGAYKSEEEALRTKKTMDDADILEVNETHQQYGYLVFSDGRVEEIVISMAKTKLKPSKNFNALIRMNGGDRFSRMYRFSTVEATNAAGDQYLNFDIANLGYVPRMIYERAEKLYDLAVSGHVTMDRTYDAEGDDAPGDGDGKGKDGREY